MINIKDIEEKKRIIAYFLCRQKNGIGLEHIFRLWTQQWSNDFVDENGENLRMYDHKIIVSKRKLHKGVPLPECCEEYNTLLNEIYDWMCEKYDNNVGRRANADMFKDMIFTYREQCRQNFYKTFNNSKLKENGYSVIKQFSKRHPLILSNYCIFHKNRNGQKKCVFSGSYENAMDFITKKMEEI